MGDQLRFMRAAQELGEMLNLAGKFVESHRLLKETLSIYKSLEDHLALAVVNNELGRTLLHLGQYEQAYAYAQQSLALFQKSDIPWRMPLFTLGQVTLAQERYIEAQRLLQEGVSLARQARFLL